MVDVLSVLCELFACFVDVFLLKIYKEVQIFVSKIQTIFLKIWFKFVIKYFIH